MTDERATGVQTLLAEAEAAHGTYEATELNGVYDREWAQWYARHMVEHGIGRMLGYDVSADDLGAFLASAYAAFEQLDTAPPDGWAAYVARRIVAEL
jgi:hypothetical protein